MHSVYRMLVPVPASVPGLSRSNPPTVISSPTGRRNVEIMPERYDGKGWVVHGGAKVVREHIQVVLARILHKRSSSPKHVLSRCGRLVAERVVEPAQE